VALTQDPERRADRALAATQAQLHAGAFGEALRLLAVAEAEAVSELQRSRVDLLRGQIASAAGPGTEASIQLLKAAGRLKPLDVVLARETYLDAWGAALFAGDLGRNGLLIDVSEAALSAPPSSDPPRPSDLLLDGLSLLIAEGRTAALPTLRKAVVAFRGEEISVEKGLQWGVLASTAAATLWDFESWDAVISRQMELARIAGALAPLSIALNGEGIVLAWRGDFTTAAAVAAEADAVTHATGTRIAPYGALFLTALTGEERRGFVFIEAEMNLARARGEGMAVQFCQWTTAVLSNGLARYEQAQSLSRQASEEAPELFIAAWALPELIEAAIRNGNEPIAVDALDRLANSTNPNESDWARGIFARCQALVSDGETAEAHYREAIECLGRTPLRPEHARANLLYGEWLRRQNRRLDARAQLRSAYDVFSEIGMMAFAERAERELQATGETVRKRREDTRNDLTPQEEQIARLALAGRTNPEIGAQLFISARTVEWHLRKVFTKLGITSRRGLRDALPARTGTDRRN
jgi:DNA-binding CsgD family transcriptional regulator